MVMNFGTVGAKNFFSVFMPVWILTLHPAKLELKTSSTVNLYCARLNVTFWPYRFWCKFKSLPYLNQITRPKLIFMMLWPKYSSWESVTSYAKTERLAISFKRLKLRLEAQSRDVIRYYCAILKNWQSLHQRIRECTRMCMSNAFS